MSQCNKCGGHIRFVRTLAGLTLPLDAEPSQAGTIEVTSAGYARIIPTEQRPASQHLTRYTSHLATCPFDIEQRQGGRPRKEPTP